MREASVKGSEKVVQTISDVSSKLQENQVVKDISQNFSKVQEKMIQVNENLKVGEKVQTSTRIVYDYAKPQVSKLVKHLSEKAEELDSERGYIPKIHDFANQMDEVMGVTRSFQAIQKEFKQGQE
jgi:hypothetical protein